MSLITIILFFIYSWGLGFTITSFIKNSENFLERNLIRIGIGLGVFIVLGILLNLLYIPLDWKIFLALSLIYPLFALFKKIRNKEFKRLDFKFRLTKSNLNILVILIIFFFCLYMYTGGALKYPYLEDEDPWSHSVSTKYISVEKTADAPENYYFPYIDPYPPGYTILMGVLHQTSASISWTLKFFNGLVLSLGIVFFYFFAKLFTNSRNKALFATFVLVALPSYFTHFIWAHSLAIMLFFPAMYCLEMIRYDKKWMYPAIAVIASILLTQPSQAVKLGIMLGIYWIVKAVIERNFLKNIFITGTGGVLLSFIWWFGKTGSMFSEAQQSINEGVKASLFERLQSAFSPTGGTATEAYSFSDFFIAKSFGGINIHLGWGIVISMLVVLGLIYCIIKYKNLLKKENSWIVITLAWFIFTFLGTNSMTFNLPFGLFAFRFWLLLAIPVALISSAGLYFLYGLSKGLKIPKIIILLVIIIGIIATAGYQKYNQNYNAMWPPGGFWTSQEELQGYLWLKTLPVNTKVFKYSNNDEHIIGLDKYSCSWCYSVIKFREDILDKDVDKLHSFLKREKYKYMIISGMSYRELSGKFGENKTKEAIDNLLIELQHSNKFLIAHQTKGAVIFKVI